MDYDKLIEDLRRRGLGNGSALGHHSGLYEDAALAIETLRAENIMHHNAADNYFAEANEYREERNDALTELEQMAACIYYKPGGLCPNNKSAEKVLADLARVTAERDAAVEDLEEIMFKGGHNIDTCHFCTNGQCYGRGGTQVCDPKWRGIKRED